MASESLMPAPAPAPFVGVAVFILKGKTVLLGRRLALSAIGPNTFAIPSGHLEFGESFEECAAREVKEETGLDIKNMEFLTARNHVVLNEKKPAHFVAVFMRAILKDESQVAQTLEPENCGGWEWYDWNHLPNPLMPALGTLLHTGFNPFPSSSS